LTLRDWHGNPRAALIQAVVLVAVIAMVDWRVDLNLAFGFLYLFPMLLVGTALPRWQVVLAALFCTLLSDLFDPFRFTLGTALPEDILVFTSLAGTGLFAFENLAGARLVREPPTRLQPSRITVADRAADTAPVRSPDR